MAKNGSLGFEDEPEAFSIMYLKRIVILFLTGSLALLLSNLAVAEEAATAMGNVGASVLSEPFSMSSPLWPDSTINTGTVDELVDDLVFDKLSLPNTRLKDMLARRATQRQISFNFSGIPYSPLTVSLNDSYRQLNIASELRSTLVKFSESDFRSGFMNHEGKQSIFLDVLLGSPDLKRLPLSYFSLTIENN